MIKIKNNTMLNYKTLGYIIDNYKASTRQITIYAGKVDTTYFDIEESGKYYKLEVKYGKTDVTYTFSNAK